MKKVDVIIGGQYVALPLESRTNRTSAVYTAGNAFGQVSCSCGREHILHPGHSLKCTDTDITYKLEHKTYGIASKQKYFARAIVPVQSEPKEERRRRIALFERKPEPTFTQRDLEHALNGEEPTLPEFKQDRIPLVFDDVYYK